MIALDVTLVAGRRPDLLQRTLESFHNGLFRHCSVRRIIANVDPIFGSLAEQNKCVDIIRDYCRHAEVYTPDKPSFGMAVKRTWAATTELLIFHLEDDWLLLETIDVQSVSSLLSQGFSGIKPIAREHSWRGSDPTASEKPRVRIGSFSFGTRRVPVQFGTSPGFFDGSFARGFAQLVNPDLDPEKQVKTKFNSNLARYCQKHRFAYLPGTTRRELIEDIGRAWRRSQNITKMTKDGASVWTKQEGIDVD